MHSKVFQKDNVEKDVCSEDIENTETEKEQLKILEEIKQRNKERMMQEEMDMKLAEAEQQLPDSCSGAAAAGDSWPDLGQAVAGHVVGGRGNCSTEDCKAEGNSGEKRNERQHFGGEEAWGSDSGAEWTS